MSNTNTSIYSKIISFQKEMPAIKKDETNPYFKSKYATLDSIQKAIQKPLAEAGLGYTQEATSEGLKTTLFDNDGNTLEFNYPAVFQGKPQEIGSAMTYAKRYALTACLGLIIEGEDDDGQKAQESKSNNQVKAKPQIDHWMTEAEFKKALTLTPTEIQDVLKAQYDAQGRTFAMKKEYREALKLKAFQTPTETEVHLSEEDFVNLIQE